MTHPHQPIDVLAIEHQARVLRAQEAHRLAMAFGAWLGRIFSRRPATHTA